MSYEIDTFGPRYEIDTDVTFNKAKRSRHSKIMDLPFAQLQVDQSFHIPFEASEPDITKAQTQRLSAWCQIAGKKLNARFSLRTVDSSDKRGPGLRIWRLADKGASLDSLFAPKADQEPTEAASDQDGIVLGSESVAGMSGYLNRADFEAAQVIEPTIVPRRRRKAQAV